MTKTTERLRDLVDKWESSADWASENDREKMAAAYRECAEELAEVLD